jgi:putative FmdB family regulatory protein
MPTYEYECQKCGHHFEQFQGMTEKPLKRCPKCGGKIDRLLGTGAGIIFKGSGFYETDYRSKNYKEAAKKEKGESDSKPVKKDSGKTGSSAPKQSGTTTTKTE